MLLTVSTFPPDHGGAGLRLKRQYERLSELTPMEVTVLSLAGRSSDPGTEEHGQFTVHRFPYGRLGVLYEVVKFTLSSRSSRFDYAHIAGRNRLSVLSFVAGKVLGLPIVHELTETEMDDKPGSNPGIRDAIVRSCMRRADFNIALNSSMADRYRSYGVPSDNIWIRPTPVNTDRFYPVGNDRRMALRNRLSLPEDKTLHLVVGRMQSRKNQLFALKVLRHLPKNHQLILIGPVFDRDREYFNQLTSFRDEHGLGSRVTLVPEFVENVDEYLRTVDSCWIPSRREGTPNVMLEALCSGIPVFVNRTLNLEEFLYFEEAGSSMRLEEIEFADRIQQWFASEETERRRKTRATRVQDRHQASKVDRHFLDKIQNNLTSP